MSYAPRNVINTDD